MYARFEYFQRICGAKEASQLHDRRGGEELAVRRHAELHLRRHRHVVVDVSEPEALRPDELLVAHDADRDAGRPLVRVLSFHPRGEESLRAEDVGMEGDIDGCGLGTDVGCAAEEKRKQHEESDGCGHRVSEVSGSLRHRSMMREQIERLTARGVRGGSALADRYRGERELGAGGMGDALLRVVSEPAPRQAAPGGHGDGGGAGRRRDHRGRAGIAPAA